jgi:hypothetical protein
MFTVISTLLFLLLMLMWRSNDPTNLIIKFGLALMTGWGGYLIYTNQMFG